MGNGKWEMANGKWDAQSNRRRHSSITSAIYPLPFPIRDREGLPSRSRLRCRLEDLVHLVGQHRVQALVGDDDRVVRGIDVEPARLLDDPAWTADRKARRNLAVVVDAPHAHVAGLLG